MDVGNKAISSIFAGIVFSVLILGLGDSQNAYGGGVIAGHVWSGGAGTSDWSDDDNWFENGSVPHSVETHPIYIGCDFAPFPEGEGPVPTGVTVRMNKITVDVIRNGGGGMLNLCEGSTLIVDDSVLRFVEGIPASPTNKM